ncbi:MAG: molybdopterin cofactor-binding domain-containing protein [Pseudomonadota bacterium]
MKHVGRSVARLDGPRHAAGKSRFLTDLEFPRQLHMHLVRSQVARGTVRDVLTEGAFTVPGVVAVWTAEDISHATVRAPLEGPYAALCPEPVLAGDSVHYRGEAVAAVFAHTADAAEDAAERIILDIAEEEPVLHFGNAQGAHQNTPSPGAEPVSMAYGDLNLAFHNADFTVERCLSVACDAPMAQEPRVAAALWDGGSETLRVWSAARPTLEGRRRIADAVGAPISAVVWEQHWAGGHFGAQAELCAEDVLVAMAARRLGQPVRWVEDPAERQALGGHGPGFEARARAAVSASGALLGLDVRFCLDLGAYPRPGAFHCADLIVSLLPGPYPPRAYRVAGQFQATNRAPMGFRSGGGRMEATFVRERLLDAAAAELGIAPSILRARNLSAPSGSGRDTAQDGPNKGLPTASVRADGHAVAQVAEESFALSVLRQRAAERRTRGSFCGFGIAQYVDVCGGGPFDRARVRIEADGGVEVVVSLAERGRGSHTAVAQIVADVIGVDYRRVRVRSGDLSPSEIGVSPFLRGGLTAAATSALLAAEALREKIARGAAQVLGIAPHNIAIRSGRVCEAGRNFGRSLELGELASAMAPGAAAECADGHGLFAEGVHRSSGVSFPSGLAAASVDIDAKTGFVRVQRVFLVHDVGNAINPGLAEAQLTAGAHGGVVAALYGAADPAGYGEPGWRGGSSSSFTGADLPPVEVALVERGSSAQNPLGINGIGSAGVVGVGSAMAAAVDDALGAPGFVERLPIDPRTIWAKISADGAAQSGGHARPAAAAAAKIP